LLLEIVIRRYVIAFVDMFYLSPSGLNLEKTKLEKKDFRASYD